MSDEEVIDSPVMHAAAVALLRRLGYAWIGEKWARRGAMILPDDIIATERALFERYMSDGGNWPHAMKRSPDGNYIRVDTQLCWVVWQAARFDIVGALQWYADGLHFNKSYPDKWDTVTGESQNWWCDGAGTATVEDGSIAKRVLRGELTAAQVWDTD